MNSLFVHPFLPPPGISRHEWLLSARVDRLDAVVDALPAGAAAVVHRAMAIEPERRFPDMEALVEALETVRRTATRETARAIR